METGEWLKTVLEYRSAANDSVGGVKWMTEWSHKESVDFSGKITNFFKNVICRCGSAGCCATRSRYKLLKMYITYAGKSDKPKILQSQFGPRTDIVASISNCSCKFNTIAPYRSPENALPLWPPPDWEPLIPQLAPTPSMVTRPPI